MARYFVNVTMEIFTPDQGIGEKSTKNENTTPRNIVNLNTKYRDVAILARFLMRHSSTGESLVIANIGCQLLSNHHKEHVSQASTSHSPAPICSKYRNGTFIENTIHCKTLRPAAQRHTRPRPEQIDKRILHSSAQSQNHVSHNPAPSCGTNLRDLYA